MPREKPPVHGRDHRPGGFDPLAWLPAWILEQISGFLHWGTNTDDDNLGLVLNTTGQDIIIESLGGDVGQQVRLVSGGQINSIAASQNLLEGDTVIVDGSTSVLIEGVSVETLSGNIEEKIPAGTGNRWRVCDNAGTSILEILNTGSISANSHKIHDVTDPTSAQDAATKAYVDAGAGGAIVTSVFGRGGAVVAVTGDYAGVVAAFLTGATQASRYVGATTSGAPVSGTFATGDFVVARDGRIFVCTSGGSPGTWADVGTSASFATPSIALGSAAAAGSAGTVIRSDATIAAFDATAPTTQTFGDAAAVGTSAFAARRDHKHAWPANVTESNISLAAANTTNDVTITKHGFVPIAPNDTAKFLRGDGTWNTANLPSGSAAVATDAIWDTKGDLAAATGADAAVKVSVGSDYDTLQALASATPGVAWQPGGSVLLYDYTVAGSDKASIDTGADTPNAGIAGTSAFPALRMLEIFIYGRTDESVTRSDIDLTFNNDAGTTHYFNQYARVVGTIVSGVQSNSQAGWEPVIAGGNFTASVFGVTTIWIPNYASTVGFKSGTYVSGIVDGTSADASLMGGFNYNQTTAITRFKFTPHTAGKKLKVGTRLLIYAR